VADWGSGMSPGCTAGQLFAGTGNGWPHNVLCNIISSCQSVAISDFASLTHVRSAITSIFTPVHISAPAMQLTPISISFCPTAIA